MLDSVITDLSFSFQQNENEGLATNCARKTELILLILPKKKKDCKSLELSVNHIIYNNKALLMAVLSYKEPEGDIL